MKTFNMKSIAFTILATIIFVGLGATSPASARGEADKFCNKIGPISQKMISGMQDKKHKVLPNRSLDQSKIISLRADSDKKRQELYSRLYEKYPTEANKIVIDDYRASINQSLAFRRQKVDLARQKFIDEVNAMVSSREIEISNSESRVISAVQVASDIASSKCAEGGDQESIRLAFKQSLISVKDEFKIKKDSIEINRSKIESLISARDKYIESAMNEFKNAADLARDKLVNALN